MVAVVVVINVLISLLCLYVAWFLWNLRRALSVAADVVTLFDRDTHNALYGAPQAISQGQLGIRATRGSYQNLEIQLQRVQQVIAFLGLLQRLLPMVTRSSTKLNQRNLDAAKSRLRSRKSRRQQRSRR
ncbi:MAG: hypothetical protein Fur006_19430 [Coleofasciculaceae cyanobacterium]